jgi:hypothetical protein
MSCPRIYAPITIQKEYKLVQSTNPQQHEINVQEMLDKGYVIEGNLVITPNFFIQQMTKVKGFL